MPQKFWRDVGCSPHFPLVKGFPKHGPSLDLCWEKRDGCKLPENLCSSCLLPSPISRTRNPTSFWRKALGVCSGRRDWAKPDTKELMLLQEDLNAHAPGRFFGRSNKSGHKDSLGTCLHANNSGGLGRARENNLLLHFSIPQGFRTPTGLFCLASLS